MVTIQIIIDQVGKGIGTAGASRSDLDVNKQITLSNYDNSGATTFKWELISWGTDINDPNTATPTLTGSDESIAYFTPTKIGSYLIQLTVNNRIVGKVIANIPTTYLGIRLPAEEERKEFNGQDWNLINTIKQLEKGIEDLGASEGVTTFLELGDTPTTYSGFGLEYVRIKNTEDGLRFGDGTFIDLTDSPSTYSESANNIIKINNNILEFDTNTFLKLSDTPNSYDGYDGYVCKVRDDGSNEDIQFSENTFLGLSDTPSSYNDSDGYFVGVNEGEDGLALMPPDPWFVWNETDLSQFNDPYVGPYLAGYNVSVVDLGGKNWIKMSIDGGTSFPNAWDPGQKLENSLVFEIPGPTPNDDHIIVADVYAESMVEFDEVDYEYVYVHGGFFLGNRVNLTNQSGYFMSVNGQFNRPASVVGIERPLPVNRVSCSLWESSQYNKDTWDDYWFENLRKNLDLYRTLSSCAYPNNLLGSMDGSVGMRIALGTWGAGRVIGYSDQKHYWSDGSRSVPTPGIPCFGIGTWGEGDFTSVSSRGNPFVVYFKNIRCYSFPWDYRIGV